MALEVSALNHGRDDSGVRAEVRASLRCLRRRRALLGDTWHLHEVFLRVSGELLHLWRAIGQDGLGAAELSDDHEVPRRLLGRGTGGTFEERGTGARIHATDCFVHESGLAVSVTWQDQSDHGNDFVLFVQLIFGNVGSRMSIQFDSFRP
jgi:hypothetical protein